MAPSTAGVRAAFSSALPAVRAKSHGSARMSPAQAIGVLPDAPGLLFSRRLGREPLGRWLRRPPVPFPLEGIVRSGRIASRRSPDDLDDLLQFGRRQPGDDLVHALLVEQANGRYDRLGHTLGSGPAERIIIELDSVGVAMARAYHGA